MNQKKRIDALERNHAPAMEAIVFLHEGVYTHEGRTVTPAEFEKLEADSGILVRLVRFVDEGEELQG